MIRSGLFANPASLGARLARLLLFGGVAFAIVSLLPSIPREQILLFRLEEAGEIEQLNATWTVPGKAEPSGGVTLHFPVSPDRAIRHALSLPNGPYLLDISIQRVKDENSNSAAPNMPPARDPVAGEAQSKVGSDVRPKPPPTSYLRRVHLEGGETVIRL
jgi:hypothetical protein